LEKTFWGNQGLYSQKETFLAVGSHCRNFCSRDGNRTLFSCQRFFAKLGVGAHKTKRGSGKGWNHLRVTQRTGAKTGSSLGGLRTFYTEDYPRNSSDFVPPSDDIYSPHNWGQQIKLRGFCERTQNPGSQDHPLAQVLFLQFPPEQEPRTFL